MPVRLKNNARSLLAVSVTATDILIRVRVGKGERFPQLGAGDWFPLALEDDQGNVEITRCVARAGDVLTVQRGQDGTTARPFAAGALVSLRLTATAARDFVTGSDSGGGGGDGWDGDSDPSLTAPRGLIFNGLIVDAYHDETGQQPFHPYSGTSEGQYVFAGACYQAAQVLADYLEEVEALPALAITGTLPNGTAGEAYEGRLQIENAVGPCTVRQVGGDTLPDGAVIRVDPWTMEVVVEWPAAQPAAELVNPGFEEGGLDGWTTEKIGGVGGAATLSTERPQAGTYSGLWTGAKGTGHAGGTECLWTNDAVAPVLQGQMVTANMWFALKDTGSSQNRGRVRIVFRDLDGNQLRVEPGTLIRGNDSSWRPSTASYAAPANGTAELQAWTTANDSNNSGVLLDSATWTVPENVGSAEAATYCIDLVVTDERPSEATWSGCISVGGGGPGEFFFFVTNRRSSSSRSGVTGQAAPFDDTYVPTLDPGWQAHGPGLAIPGGGLYLSQYNYLSRRVSATRSPADAGPAITTGPSVSVGGGQVTYDGTYLYRAGGVHNLSRSADGGVTMVEPLDDSISRTDRIMALPSGRLIKQSMSTPEVHISDSQGASWTGVSVDLWASTPPLEFARDPVTERICYFGNGQTLDFEFCIFFASSTNDADSFTTHSPLKMMAEPDFVTAWCEGPDHFVVLRETGHIITITDGATEVVEQSSNLPPGFPGAYVIQGNSTTYLLLGEHGVWRYDGNGVFTQVVEAQGDEEFWGGIFIPPREGGPYAGWSTARSSDSVVLSEDDFKATIGPSAGDNEWVKGWAWAPSIGVRRCFEIIVGECDPNYFYVGVASQDWGPFGGPPYEDGFPPPTMPTLGGQMGWQVVRSHGSGFYATPDPWVPFGEGDRIGVVVTGGPTPGTNFTVEFYKNGVPMAFPGGAAAVDGTICWPLFGVTYATGMDGIIVTDPALMAHFDDYAANDGWPAT